MKKTIDVSNIPILKINNFCIENKCDLEINKDGSCQIVLFEIKQGGK